MKSYIVIGLGRFGAELATKLYECGEEVLAVDTNESIVDKIADHVTRAVTAAAGSGRAVAGIPLHFCCAHGIMNMLC